MALSWSGRRQLIYYAVALAAAVIVVFAAYQAFFTAAPTCFDGTQNGDEAGVDCGGSCALLCTDTARAPTVLWARAFDGGGGYYTAAAYVQNNNVGSGARAIPYSFQLFDDKNLLVIERDGVVDLPPIQTIPIIESNINVGNRVVTRTLFAFTTTPVWKKIPTTALPALHTSEQNLNQDASRLSATLVNSGVTDAKDVAVTAVLFDQGGVARAATRSIIGTVPRKSSQEIVFTWPGGVPNIVRAEITILPSF